MKARPKPAKQQHQFDRLQSVTVINLRAGAEPGGVIAFQHPETVVRVYRDENVLMPGFVIANQDLYDAIKDIDRMYRREIALALVDLPRVRRVEVTDNEGTGIVIEN